MIPDTKAEEMSPDPPVLWVENIAGMPELRIKQITACCRVDPWGSCVLREL